MSAYTDAAKIAAHLGLTLTGAQQTQAGVVADAATAWVERYTGRSWQIASPVSDEMHQLVGNSVYLANRPVSAVSVVKTRDRYADAPITTLSASEWELLDATNGVLLIQGWAALGRLALVTYTHTAASAPADVQLATTMIASAWLAQTLRPNTSGIDQLSVGQNDITVKFSASRGDVPAEALTILRAYRTVVVA